MSGTLLPNLLGVSATTIAALAALTVWQPRMLFPHEITPEKANVGLDAAPAPRVTPLFAQEMLLEMRREFQAIRNQLEKISPPLQKPGDPAGAVERLIRSMQSDLAAIRSDVNDLLEQRTSPDVADRVENRIRSAPDANLVPASATGDGDSNSEGRVHELLEALALRCMGRGLSIRKVRDEVPSDWGVDSLDSSDTPDAFLVHVSSDQTWVIPNTREWMPFRERGWFDVQGLDVVNARITAVRELPILGRKRNVIRRGSVEVAVQ